MLLVDLVDCRGYRRAILHWNNSRRADSRCARTAAARAENRRRPNRDAIAYDDAAFPTAAGSHLRPHFHARALAHGKPDGDIYADANPDAFAHADKLRHRRAKGVLPRLRRGRSDG